MFQFDVCALNVQFLDFQAEARRVHEDAYWNDEFNRMLLEERFRRSYKWLWLIVTLLKVCWF